MTKKNRLLFEIVFFIAIYFGYQSEGFQLPLNDVIAGLTLYILLYTHGLINRFFILPFLLPKKEWKKYLFFTICNLIVFSIITYKVNMVFILKYHPEQAEFFTLYNSFTSCVLSLFVMCSIEFVLQYYQREKEKADYTAIINQLENNNLKSQLNPHFLFNSLNNAYGISLAEPKRVPEYILQLSQLMRYQLESTKQEFVNLYDEIEFVKNYVAIEKERIGNRCTITFENNITTEAMKTYKVMPMLFNTFIENAIKHGASSMAASFINIYFGNQNNEIKFMVSNSIASNKMVGTQLGLKNAQQRLQILYLKMHELKITTAENIYTVNLQITLSKNV